MNSTIAAMPGPALVRRLLGAFQRKAPHVDGAMPGGEQPRPPPPGGTLHPLATTEGRAGSEPIVVAPLPWMQGVSSGSLPPPAAVVDFVDEIGQLPLFSATAMQLMRSVGDDSVSTDRIARLISADAGLVAQLLRIVNSPYYGLPQRCSTIHTAIAVLGLAPLRRTVLAAVTRRPLMGYLHDTRAVMSFWRHQLLCAALARHLAVQRGFDGEMAYTAGLMHEVGRLAILSRHPHLTDLLLDVDDGDDRLALRHERAHFGFDHAQVGGVLLARWGLPPAIVRATMEHERFTEPSDPFCAAIWRANLLAHETAREASDAGCPPPWMEAIALSSEQYGRMLQEIAALEAGSP